MGIKVTNFKQVFFLRNRLNIKKDSCFLKGGLFCYGEIILYYTHTHTSHAHTHTCMPLLAPTHMYIRMYKIQQHKYSGYFNIYVLSQKKVVVLERNLASRNNGEKNVVEISLKDSLCIVSVLLNLANSILEKNAFRCSVPYPINESCGLISEPISISCSNPYCLIFWAPEYEFTHFAVHSSVSYKIRLFWIITAYHRYSALALMTVINNNTARRFKRCKQSPYLGTTNSKILRHFRLSHTSTSHSTSTLIMFIQHKLVIADIANQKAEKKSFQFVYKLAERIILLIVFNNNITPVRHTNPTCLKLFGFRRYSKQTSVIQNFKKRGFKCLVKNTPSFCVSNAEKIFNSLNGRIPKPTADVIHFYSNKESITIPRAASFKMLFYGANNNIVSSPVWIYYNLFVHCISLSFSVNKIVPMPLAGIRHGDLNIKFGFRLRNIIHYKNVYYPCDTTPQTYEKKHLEPRNVKMQLTYNFSANCNYLRKIAAIKILINYKLLIYSVLQSVGLLILNLTTFCLFFIRTILCKYVDYQKVTCIISPLKPSKPP